MVLQICFPKWEIGELFGLGKLHSPCRRAERPEVRHSMPLPDPAASELNRERKPLSFERFKYFPTDLWSDGVRVGDTSTPVLAPTHNASITVADSNHGVMA